MKATTAPAATAYTCPMHPDVTSDHPGRCSRCGMGLARSAETDPDEGRKEPSPSEMVRQTRARWLWTNFTVMSMGLWMVSSPFTFGYAGTGMATNDVVSGAALMLFAGLAIHPRLDFVGRWMVAVVGTWLQLAPLVFWSAHPVAYATDTLIGAVSIALSVLTPMMPGMAHHMEMKKPGPDIPPGWTYNPSSWVQRAPLIFLALVGWFISRYLAAYQLGFIPDVHDPFFGEGTARVLTSRVSRSFPISDAGLGAFAYTFEMLMGWMGMTSRWRTMPWMVTFFFILVVPLGLVHITLVILQPVVVGSWCTLCLAAAFVMLLMIPLAVDEVVAMGQFLRASVRRGRPFWRTFWVGGTLEEQANKDERTPRYGSRLKALVRPMTWGVTFPWSLRVAAAAGLWMMVSPAIFGTTGLMANSDRLVGALVVTVSFVSTAEVIRAVRLLNVALGAWIVVSPWVFNAAAESPATVIVGAAIIAAALPRGPIRERYGAWRLMTR